MQLLLDEGDARIVRYGLRLAREQFEKAKEKDQEYPDVASRFMVRGHDLNIERVGHMLELLARADHPSSQVQAE